MKLFKLENLLYNVIYAKHCNDITSVAVQIYLFVKLGVSLLYMSHQMFQGMVRYFIYRTNTKTVILKINY